MKSGKAQNPGMTESRLRHELQAKGHELVDYQAENDGLSVNASVNETISVYKQHGTELFMKVLMPVKIIIGADGHIAEVQHTDATRVAIHEAGLYAKNLVQTEGLLNDDRERSATSTHFIEETTDGKKLITRRGYRTF